MAHWHALAKLRQHTDLSLDILESVTIQLGNSLRKFQKQTCALYDTRELKREEAARMRRATSGPKIADNADSATSRPPPPKSTATSTAGPSLNTTSSETISSSKPGIGRQRKTLSLKTYKNHSLGDYVETIRRNGTTDSYSTESVSLYFCSGNFEGHLIPLDGARA